ncbi:MAG: DNA polymerase domain-containing protein, partial [archaeon]
SGLHENLAVLDFSSLYPTIMISHNVSPDSLGCRHEKCREKNGAPNGHWFCLEKKGLVPEIIKSLFEKRMKIKKEAKALDKKDKRFILLNARQQALKILLNSFYGYLGYSRSRFYSRECASAITAWARQYVQWVGSEVEKAGFELLYTDTDSAFLIIPQGKSQADVSAFVEGINKQLPGVMNLELEGFFKRGIFVTKESGEGAKKKYALMDYQGNLKIVGFEYVRRDWSPIAKETQRNVIAMILSEGRPEKAIEIVRRTISDLRDGRVKNSELVVLTQIKRRLDKYDAIGPHVAAAKKAVAKGRDIDVGSVVGYIVTKCGKSISDKAQLQEYVSEGNYDADYYIEHQVVPAVIKVMRELGYSREDLIQGGKQHTLSFFG